MPAGRQHLCADRFEVGIRNGWPGALAERLAVPVSSLHALPDAVDAAAGPWSSPAGTRCAPWRRRASSPASGCWCSAPGAIGLLVALIAAARRRRGAPRWAARAVGGVRRSLGFEHVWTAATLPSVPFDAVVDASNAADLPALAVDLVEPGAARGLDRSVGPAEPRRQPALVLKDVTAIGILSASPGLAGALDLYATDRVDPAPLVAAVVGLDDVAGVLGGARDPGWGAAPKVHVDPAALTRCVIGRPLPSRSRPALASSPRAPESRMIGDPPGTHARHDGRERQARSAPWRRGRPASRPSQTQHSRWGPRTSRRAPSSSTPPGPRPARRSRWPPRVPPT